MSTGDQRSNTYSGKILTSPDFQLRIYDNLRKQTSDFIRNAYSETGGFFSPVALSAGAANDQLTVSEVRGYNENAAFVLPAPGWDEYLVNVDFPNETGDDYEVLIHPAEIPASAESNQRTGEIAFKYYEEAIGDIDEPQTVINNGDVNLTLEIQWPGGIGSAIDEDYSGRTAFVWLKSPMSLTEYIEELPVEFSGGTCKVTTAGLFGQGVASPISTDPVDYLILIAGPTIVPFSLKADKERIYVGEFPGNGPGSAPSGFDYTDQVVFGQTASNTNNILQLARDLYTSPVLNGDGLPTLLTPIQTTVDTHVLNVSNPHVVTADQIAQATFATRGVAELATQAETDAGADNERIVTPVKLKLWSGRYSHPNHSGEVTSVGDGATTISDNVVTVDKLAHGGNDLVFITNDSGVPGLAKITETKVAGKVARRNGSLSSNESAGLAAFNTPGKHEPIVFDGDGFFPVDDGTYTQWRVRRFTNPGIYLVRPPHVISGGVITLDFDNSDVIAVCSAINTNRLIAFTFEISQYAWTITSTDHDGVAANTPFYFATLAID